MTADFVPLTPEQIAECLRRAQVMKRHGLGLSGRAAIQLAETCQHYAEDARRLREALAPGVMTKAVYMGSFNFPFRINIAGKDVTFTPNVPWVTIMSIMNAIRARADGAPITAAKEGE